MSFLGTQHNDPRPGPLDPESNALTIGDASAIVLVTCFCLILVFWLYIIRRELKSTFLSFVVYLCSFLMCSLFILKCINNLSVKTKDFYDFVSPFTP